MPIEMPEVQIFSYEKAIIFGVPGSNKNVLKDVRIGAGYHPTVKLQEKSSKKV